MIDHEEIHSFPFCEKVAGIEHAYRITEVTEHEFGVEKDGRLVARVGNDGNWKQLSGEPLEDGLFEKITDRIEEHYC